MLENGELKIVPEAAEHIRMIYQMYLDGLGMASIANRLTDRGYRKVTYKNRKDTTFSPHFVKGVLDNPIYMGKIAYGRRRTEKVEGTRNEYHIVKQDDYELHGGVHEAIIDEATWMRVHEMRTETGVGSRKRYSMDHAHLLSGILKCPVCGAGLYGNVNRKKNKDGSGEHYAVQREMESPFGGEGTYYSMGENEVLGYTNEFRWDKRGHEECVALMSRVTK